MPGKLNSKILPTSFTRLIIGLIFESNTILRYEGFGGQRGCVGGSGGFCKILI